MVYSPEGKAEVLLLGALQDNVAATVWHSVVRTFASGGGAAPVFAGLTQHNTY